MIGQDVAGVGFASWFRSHLPGCELTWYGGGPLADAGPASARPLSTLGLDQPPVVVVMEDQAKEAIIRAALPHLGYSPKLVVAGYEHYSFTDPLFSSLLADLLVPSIANGYPNTLTHIFQCVRRAAELELKGALVEFGVFRGGTTMFLAKLRYALRQSWPILGFDTFGGFPPRRSPLDMYDHPGAEFHDFEAVQRYLSDAEIELVKGDIVETASQLGDRPVVLGFIDTDNYSSATAATTALRDNVVVGGAIIFDHLTGVDRFRYTLGERMAATPLLEDPRYFNLHGTGVFLRQQ
ncbi:TylF/MycF/NovP-related O-methyltransferase [Microbacterium sp. CFBP 8794]|uniref:TylF/MycF/NovP-related O-methyltransferase n=1 Tax=Microbacterium sp. CFBP 8794 TaxID=2775269 RepID=UPI0017806B1B|nr:TylF/MycF/NovP-related O-methyltransferase [Microbacterium sp. CFBP 8794]MBD8478957.1 class I SAM-dependent methyltransferase [Microbacterium sp. CFBP 8794]